MSSDLPTEIAVRLLSLPTRQVLRAGHDPDPAPDRELVVLRLVDAEGNVGWGECSALNRPTYTAEWAAGAFATYQTALASADPDAALAGQPMAQAGWEMARLDLALRRRGQSLAASLGVERTHVPAGIAIGLGDDQGVLDQVDAAVDAGFARIKLKIEPGPSVARARQVRRDHPGIELHLDGNATFGPDDLPLLEALVESGCRIIEQPFAVDDTASAAELIQRGALVIADEAVDSVADAERLLAANALSGVAIKPARVGGIGSALELLRWCRSHDLDATAGGMLECGLGRHALAAVAAVDGFTLTGDLSPARRWLAADPWPDLSATLQEGTLAITVPQGPGIAPDPDPDLLDQFTRSTFSQRTT